MLFIKLHYFKLSDEFEGLSYLEVSELVLYDKKEYFHCIYKVMDSDNTGDKKVSKEANLAFFKDGYTIASREITDFDSLTPLFKGIQMQYEAISQLTQSFALRTHREGKPIQCEKGCEWCCYQPVYMTTQEAVLIYEFIQQVFDKQQNNEILLKARAKYKQTKHLTEQEKQKIKVACPFLNDGSCSIYSVRPMACRIYLSSDRNSCKQKFKSHGNEGIVPALFDFILKAGKYMNEGFVSFLKGKGRKMEELTIEEFMIKLFGQPNFYYDWLNKDSFADGDSK
jgi:Fe-S-cluster containining protein